MFRTICALALVATSASSQSMTDMTEQQWIEMLIEDYRRADGFCRGNPGDWHRTWEACGARTYQSLLLRYFDMCLGRYDQPASEAQWHECTENSIGPNPPAYYFGD
ncbi:hypothetical protein [Mameliella alba]|uniref:Uncharacterized protein n=1 Tax=Mameliella alba TaxID=561184 RepID=A0A0B3S101_9RHOB|nr:hypothetical protein [Mameliella alba]KHQ50296.1 hypothetical protein OA50_05144 [Mameliella alba]